MRVVGGTHRGQKILSPNGCKVRPTSDRIREAMFDLLGPDPAGDWVLDLYAGTGALGLEALSRGFARAVFVERDRAALKLIADNLLRLRLHDRAQVLAQDVHAFLGGANPYAAFDLVLCDPPYGVGAASRAVCNLARSGWVAPTGVVIVESERDADLPQQVAPLCRAKHKRYGSTEVWVYFVDNPGGVR